jgi:hypothetical protein
MQGLAAGISVGLVTALPPQLQGPGAGRETASWQQQQQQAGGEAGAVDGSSTGEMVGYSGYIAQGSGESRGYQQQQQQSAEEAAAAVAAGTAEQQQQQQDDDDELADGSTSDGSGSDSSSSSGSDDEQESSSSSSSSGLLRSSYGPALLLTDIQGIEDHHGDMDFKVRTRLEATCYVTRHMSS